MLALGLLQAAGSPSLIGTIVPMVLMFVLAYFLLIRPVQKQRKEQDEMRRALKPGDEVLTTGGVYGTVKRLRDDRIHLRVADGVEIEVAKTAISGTVTAKARE
jgi:preprotein translocase subunit YajC